MTKHSDSPEVTRLSDEQAEERTAREIRDRATAFQISRHRAKYPNHSKECVTCNYGMVDADSNLLAEFAESECSRLASRVEELEKLLAKHSGSLNCADSASNTESSNAAKEIR